MYRGGERFSNFCFDVTYDWRVASVNKKIIFMFAFVIGFTAMDVHT